MPSIKTQRFLSLLLGFTVLSVVSAGASGLAWNDWFPQTASIKSPTVASRGQVLGAAIVQPFLRFNVPATFNSAVTAAVLAVEGESTFGSTIQVTDTATFLGDVIIDGELTLKQNITGEDIDIDLQSGTIIASNLVYSVKAGSGIKVSGDQNLEIENDDKGSDQKIFSKIIVGDEVIEADSNTDELELAAGDGVTITRDGNTVTFAGGNLSGFYKPSSGIVALLNNSNNVGIGTAAPSSKLEVDSGVADLAGLTFTRLTSASAIGVGGGKVLSVDSGGHVVLVEDQVGQTSTPSAEVVLPDTSTGGTLYYNGAAWVGSTNLYHDGGRVGISTINPNGRLHIYGNDASTPGLIVQGYNAQTANLTEWRDFNDNLLSFIDEDGAFNGTITGSVNGSFEGTINPGFTTGSVVFMGASGLAQDNSNFFWNDTTNRLGIGTTSPQESIDVAGNIRIGPSAGTTTGNLYVKSNVADTYASLTAAGSGSNTTLVTSTKFRTSELQSPTLTTAGTNQSMTIAPNGTGSVLFTGSGNVGIGTGTPVAKLHVSGMYGNNAAAIINQTGSGDILTASSSGTTKFTVANNGDVQTGNIMTLGGATQTAGRLQFFNNAVAIARTGASGLQFETGAGGGVKMTLDSSGYLGLGTTTPTALLHASSTSTTFPTNGLGLFDWSPASATTTTGDLFSLNVGALGTVGNIFNVKNNGSSLFSVSQAQITNALPTQFTSAGDLSVAYDLNMTNTTASFIKSNASLYLQAGEVFNSSDLVLRTFNSGNLVLDAPGGLTSSQAQTWLLASSSAALNIHAGLFNLDTNNRRVGIGTTSPANLLHVNGTDGTAVMRIGSTPALGVVGGYTFYQNNLSNLSSNGKILGAHYNNTEQGSLYFSPNNGINNWTAGWVLQVTTNGRAITMAADQFKVGGKTSSDNINFMVDNLTGNVGIRTTTPIAPLHVAGAYGNNAAVIIDQLNSGAILTASSSGTTRFTVNNNATAVSFTNTGIWSIGGGLSFSGAAPSTNTLKFGQNGVINRDSVGSGVGINVITYSGSENSTSGTTNFNYFQNGFAPTSGTSIFNQMSLTAIVNQTGGANGITRGMFIAPTLTAAADWRSIETANNSGYALYAGGTADSYFGGAVGIGTTDPGSNMLKVQGDFEVTGACTGCSSDERLKKDITQLSGSSLAKLLSIKGVSYSWSDPQRAADYPGTQIGVIAQDVEAVFPELVGVDSRGYKFVRYDKLIAPTIEAIREQQNQITTLDTSVHTFSTSLQALQITDNGSITDADAWKNEIESRLASLEEESNIAATTSGQTAGLGQKGLIPSISTWVKGAWTFIADVTFAGKAKFEQAVAFVSEVVFQGRVTYEDKDMAGSVTFEEHEYEAHVEFAVPYEQKPIITLTPENYDGDYQLKSVSETGFDIWLNPPATQSAKIYWSAIMVKGATDVKAKPVPSVEPNPTATPSPTSEPTPESSTSAELGDESASSSGTTKTDE